MADRIALAIAKADGQDWAMDPERYGRLALAALEPLTAPSAAMVDAAHQAVWFDAAWAINSHRDFRTAVRAMIAYAIAEGHEAVIRQAQTTAEQAPSSASRRTASKARQVYAEQAPMQWWTDGRTPPAERDPRQWSDKPVLRPAKHRRAP
jgi:hypothetical protein